MKKYDRLIFVSNSDTCRGPMAEAILKSKFLLSELEVESRGLVVLFPEPVNQKAEAILASHGLTMKDHTAKMLEKLQGEGHIYGLDVDPIESAKTKKRLEEKGFGPDILTVKLENFANIDKVAEEAGKFDFVLADLGVSSMQIDNPDRGFTFKAEGPLDLRMNPEKGISAAERLRDIPKKSLPAC